jgi:hypothetical protein
MPVKAIKTRLGGISTAFKALTDKVVLVGIPAANADRKDANSSKGVTNAQIAYWNEYGVPENNLPARPHFAPAIASIEDQIAERLKVTATRVFSSLKGDVSEVEKNYHILGLMAQRAVQGKIRATLSPALSPRTLRARRTRKVAPRTGTQPLIDTGAYIQSITYVIQKKSEL